MLQSEEHVWRCCGEVVWDGRAIDDWVGFQGGGLINARGT
jgi:hypothetical protein